ncbi:MAG: amidohydrolase family protein [Thermoprotei archaeon]
MRTTIKNARTPFTANLWDIAIEGGRISTIQGGGTLSGSDVIDAQGGLVCPGFIDAHIHLDKVYTLDWDESGEEEDDKLLSTQTIIPTLRPLKAKFTEEDLLRRGRRALEESLLHGTVAHRAFVDVDSTVGLKCLSAALKLKQEFKGLVDIQVVAFPQEGLAGKAENVELLYRAIELGADVVGGIPWYENTAEEAQQHLDVVFDVAKSAGKDIHIVADDTDDPLSTNILRFASKCIREGFTGRCAASQCRGALDASNEAYAGRVVALAKSAGLTVVENPHTSLMLSGGGGVHPLRRGVTRVVEFARAGVNVAAGQDDIQDAYYPYGRGSMVEVGFVMSHAIRTNTTQGLHLVYNMLTQNGAQMMKLKHYGVAPGCAADILIFEEKSLREVFKNMARPKYVLRNGATVLVNSTETRFYRPPPT